MIDLNDTEWRALNYIHIAPKAKRSDPFWRGKASYAANLIVKGFINETSDGYCLTDAGKRLLGLLPLVKRDSIDEYMDAVAEKLGDGEA